jgi:hypothetical protein
MAGEWAEWRPKEKALLGEATWREDDNTMSAVGAASSVVRCLQRVSTGGA